MNQDDGSSRRLSLRPSSVNVKSSQELLATEKTMKDLLDSNKKLKEELEYKSVIMKRLEDRLEKQSQAFLKMGNCFRNLIRVVKNLLASLMSRENFDFFGAEKIVEGAFQKDMLVFLGSQGKAFAEKWRGFKEQQLTYEALLKILGTQGVKKMTSSFMEISPERSPRRQFDDDLTDVLEAFCNAAGKAKSDSLSKLNKNLVKEFLDRVSWLQQSTNAAPTSQKIDPSQAYLSISQVKELLISEREKIYKVVKRVVTDKQRLNNLSEQLSTMLSSNDTTMASAKDEREINLLRSQIAIIREKLEESKGISQKKIETLAGFPLKQVKDSKEFRTKEIYSSTDSLQQRSFNFSPHDIEFTSPKEGKVSIIDEEHKIHGDDGEILSHIEAMSQTSGPSLNVSFNQNKGLKNSLWSKVQPVKASDFLKKKNGNIPLTKK